MMRKILNKRAMSQFEIIGFAILAIVVIIVAIVIFTKLSKGPADTIGKFNSNSNDNAQYCIDHPQSCDPFGNPKSTTGTTANAGSGAAGK